MTSVCTPCFVYHATQVKAEEDQRRAVVTFRRWASGLVPDALHMNVASGSQIRQLLFPEHPGIISR